MPISKTSSIRRVQRRRRNPIVRRKRAVRARSNRKLATVSLVKKMIHRNMENKFNGTSYAVEFNGVITSSGDAYGLLPPISTGTSDNARIGNRITPRGLLVTCSVYCTSDQSTPPQTVLLPRIFVLKSKAISYQPNLTGWNYLKLLDHGQGEHAFDGTLMSYRSPVNTDAFTVVKDIKTQLCMGSVEQNPNYIKHFKFWVPCPKVLEYNDGDTFPQNFAPFLCLGFATGDGGVPTDGYLGVSMDWTTTLYYEDA